MLKQQCATVWGRQAKANWLAQQQQQIQNRVRILGHESGKCGRHLSVPQSAWPPLQAQHQNQQAQHFGSGPRGVANGGSAAVKRSCGGTGVFLPRPCVNAQESRKKTSNYSKLLPSENNSQICSYFGHFCIIMLLKLLILGLPLSLNWLIHYSFVSSLWCVSWFCLLTWYCVVSAGQVVPQFCFLQRLFMLWTSTLTSWMQLRNHAMLVVFSATMVSEIIFWGYPCSAYEIFLWKSLADILLFYFYLQMHWLYEEMQFWCSKGWVWGQKRQWTMKYGCRRNGHIDVWLVLEVEKNEYSIFSKGTSLEMILVLR